MLRGLYMKRFGIFSVLSIFLLCNAQAAVPQQRRGTASATSNNTASTATRTNAVSARSATTTARAATPTATTTARAATTGRTTVARSATTSTASSTPVVAARAGATQKVINTGTKIAAATENTVVSDACRQKYYGCMDSFCMLDNDSGGRCICSDRNAELDSVLAEIEKLDQQSYQMATTGVERIEMGDAADAAIANATAVADSILNADEEKNERTLDLSLWNVSFDDDEYIFGSTDTMQSAIEGKEGDALYRAVNEVCIAQIPECASELSMLQLMYSQQIKSDCSAYENSLKQQKTASAQKLAAAEKALRDAALEQYRSSNKYDLGQCTVEFKSCMITTGGCGEDFSQCASVVASDNTNTSKSTSRKVKNYSIKGATTTIEISASTYDTLVAKKPLCESVTKNCVSVADQVWDTFLKEVAPQLKSAELIAEDNARQNCIGSISDCFQKACKDNIDPNDPDGSYDMCLTRPETMLNLCKVPLNACGIDATSAETAGQSSIWDYVVARLASMRVDSCTTAVKECLQSEDRCGPDYTQCIGLDTDSIMRICPAEKLTGCQYVYGSEEEITSNDQVYDELYNMVQGIMLNIDNSFMTQCQKALDESMIKVCGDTENCDGLVVDNGAGTRSFKYQVCQYSSIDTKEIKWTGKCYDSLDAIPQQELQLPDGQGWAGKLSGTVYWGDISYNPEGEGSFTPMSEYITSLEQAGYTIDEDTRSVIEDLVYGVEIRTLQNAVNSAISTIEADPTVQYCMTGREVQGMRTSQSETRQVIGRKTEGEGENATKLGRFPNLTKQIRQIIANSALKTARENYNKRYDEEVARMMQDQVKAAEKIDLAQATEAAKNTCAAWAESSSLPTSKAPSASQAGKWIGVGLLVAAAVVASVFTFGVGGIALATTAGIIVASASTAAVGTAVGLAASDNQVGKKNVEQWNYKENITTTFNPTTGECVKVRVYQNCAEVKKNYCKKWEDPKETRDSVQLLSTGEK